MAPRTWEDERDGRVWEVDATPRMQTMEGGTPIAMMNEVPWTVSFERDESVHEIAVDYTVGSRVRAMTDDELQELLDLARTEGRP